MSSGTLVRERARISDLRARAARRLTLGSPSFLGPDVLLLLAAASLALCVFEVAGWLASAPLATLVFSVSLVPLALFLTAIVSGRDGSPSPTTQERFASIKRKP
jgi:hypothetical protein